MSALLLSPRSQAYLFLPRGHHYYTSNAPLVPCGIMAYRHCTTSSMIVGATCAWFKVSLSFFSSRRRSLALWRSRPLQPGTPKFWQVSRAGGGLGSLMLTVLSQPSLHQGNVYFSFLKMISLKFSRMYWYQFELYILNWVILACFLSGVNVCMQVSHLIQNESVDVSQTLSS